MRSAQGIEYKLSTKDEQNKKKGYALLLKYNGKTNAHSAKCYLCDRILSSYYSMEMLEAAIIEHMRKCHDFECSTIDRQ